MRRGRPRGGDLPLRPPKAVYPTVLSGMMKQAAYVLTPVRALITAEPPRINIAYDSMSGAQGQGRAGCTVTMRLVRRQKNKKVRCAAVPQRTSTISRMV
eukprot:747595-Hanusia_phi.AAC.3